jgi:hypothetical protein
MKYNLNAILKIFNNFMAFIYVLAGIYIIFSHSEFLSINSTFKIFLGSVIIAYGVYRIYRVFRATSARDEA